MRKLLPVAVLSFFCSVANAQISNFTGFSLGGNIEFKAPTLKLAATGVEFEGLGSQNIIVSASADYGVELSKSSVLLVGGKYDVQNTPVVKITVGGEAVTIEEKGHYSLFVAPGILLSDKTLGFVKLSYENAKVGVAGLPEIDEQSVSGMGYGLGVRTNLGGNANLDVEVGRIVYDAKDISTGKLTSGTTYGRVGFSFKF